MASRAFKVERGGWTDEGTLSLHQYLFVLVIYMYLYLYVLKLVFVFQVAGDVGHMVEHYHCISSHYSAHTLASHRLEGS